MRTIKDDLLRWICERRATCLPLDRRLLRDEAVELARIKGLSESKCTDRWLTAFLRAHGFSASLATDRGPKFADYRDWIELMRPTITRYRHRDVFHADELSMYAAVDPTSVSRHGVSAGETRGARITALLCCNSSGTDRLPLVICGPYPSRTMLNEHAYYPSKDSAVGDHAIGSWLSMVNERARKRDRRILLFLRRRLRGDLELSNVNLVFLPEDFPPLLRPLRRDVFRCVKMIYRRRYADCLRQCPASWTRQDVLETLAEAWQRVPAEIVVCSFQRTRFRTDDTFLQISCDSWPDLKTGISFRRFVTFDDELSDVKDCQEPVGNRGHRYNLRVNTRSEIHGDRCRSFDRTIDRVDDAVNGLEGLDNEDDRGDLSEEIAQDLSKDVPKDERRFEVTQNFRNREIKQLARLRKNELERSTGSLSENVFSSVDIDGGPSKGTEGRQRDELVGHKGTDCVVTIRDGVSAMTSTTKTNYVGRPADNILTSDEEAGRQANSRLMGPTCSGKSVIESREGGKVEQTKRADREEESPDKNDAQRRNCTSKENKIACPPCPSKYAVERFSFASREDGSRSYSNNDETRHCSLTSTREDNEGNRNKCSSKDETVRPSCASKKDQSMDVTTADLSASPFCSHDLNVQNNSSSSPSSSAERRRTVLNDKSEKTLYPNFGIRDSETISPAQTESENTKSFKRRRSKAINVDGSGDNSNDNEPVEKRSRTNSEWSKKYETTFVFGSPRASESSPK